jgi:hypothetical protein
MKKDIKVQLTNKLDESACFILFSPIENKVFLIDDGYDVFAANHLAYKNEADFVSKLIFFADNHGFSVEKYFEIAPPETIVNYSFIDETPPSFQKTRYIVAIGDIVDESKASYNDDDGTYIPTSQSNKIYIVGISHFDKFLYNS